MGTVRDQVILNGLTFNDPTEWWRVCDVMDGWEDTPPLELLTMPNGNGPGALVSATPRHQERPLVLAGAILAGSRDEAETARQGLLDAIPPGVEVPVDRMGRRMFVWLSERIETDLITPRGFRWVATTLAVDPFRYTPSPLSGLAGISTGDPAARVYDDEPNLARTYDPDTYVRRYQVIGSSGVAIFSPGDARSRRVVVSVSGPLQAGDWRVVNDATGDVFRLDLTLGAAQTAVLDANTQQATISGQDATQFFFGDWPRVVPGNNVFRLLAGAFSPQAAISVAAYPAWR